MFLFFWYFSKNFIGFSQIVSVPVSEIVIRIRIPGFETINDDVSTTTIKVGAGESWDQTVKRTVDMRLTGMEALSMIPGTVGGAPVQNIGAYGALIYMYQIKI